MRFTRCRFSPDTHFAGEEPVEDDDEDDEELLEVEALAAPTSKTATTPLVVDAATTSVSL